MFASHTVNFYLSIHECSGHSSSRSITFFLNYFFHFLAKLELICTKPIKQCSRTNGDHLTGASTPEEIKCLPSSSSTLNNLCSATMKYTKISTDHQLTICTFHFPSSPRNLHRYHYSQMFHAPADVNRAFLCG